MTATFIDTTDPRWQQCLSRVPHDLYHHPAYLTLAAQYEGGSPVAFYAEHNGNDFLVPLLLHKPPPALAAPENWLDAISPYGYPTPLLHAAARPSAVLDDFLSVFKIVAAQHDIVSVFLRLHPLLPLGVRALRKHGTLVKHGRSVYLDFSASEAALDQQVRLNHKRDVRRLERLGFRVSLDAWSLYDRFVPLYKQTMQRVAAEAFYFFPEAYFAALRQTLGNHLHLCTVHAPNDEVAAAGLFTTTGRFVQYHLSGTDDRFLHLSPLKLMMHHLGRWAKQQGYRFLHLGGGVGSRLDSLFHFKAGFSRLSADFYTYRMIINEERYRMLTSRHQARYRGKSSPSSVDFFPTYRTP